MKYSKRVALRGFGFQENQYYASLSYRSFLIFNYVNKSVGFKFLIKPFVN